MAKKTNMTHNLSLDNALDILDVDKKIKSYVKDKRGAIYTIRKHLELKQLVSMELLGAYDTCQCRLYLYKTRTTIMDETLFVLVSIHKNREKVNVRFGNKCQVDGMLETYRNKEELDFFGGIE